MRARWGMGILGGDEKILGWVSWDQASARRHTHFIRVSQYGLFPDNGDPRLNSPD
ncbi:hypothetical protein CC2G_014391 [Coprinopsis cinerea AmutBmut pab1-1]|nr:hypothetical protein CC2G_014391 [Coprinopsis cinerea AmutBmut pab1-1]